MLRTNIEKKFQVPQTPAEALKRIMNDFSERNRRSKEWHDVTGEVMKYPHVDYEELKWIVQTNSRYLGLDLKK